jgi:hypothetical protein
MTAPLTPAGWYPDPQGSGGQRYWDGFAWTEHHSPAVAPVTPAAPVPGEAHAGAHRAPDNRKLLIGFLSAVGGLLLVLTLVLVYAFAIRDDDTTQIASSGSSTSSSTTTSSESSESESSETETETESDTATPAAEGEVTDGAFTFSIASTESGDTVTSPINEFIEKTATGEYIVVYVNVGNTGTRPLTFLSHLQVLNTDTGTFTPDDEASFYLGGGVVTINPGEQVETAIAFDVPVGAAPVSILVHGDPDGAGVDLPL